MNIPTTRDLLHPMLQVARERARLSEVELSRFLAFQFGAYDGGPAIAKPSDLRRFACRVRVARRALLRHGMLASGAGDELITPQGEAYLTTGWLRTDEGAEQAGASARTPVAAEAPSPSEQADKPVVDLKALLDEAQFGNTDLGPDGSRSPSRPRCGRGTVNVRVTNGWLVLYTHVMRLPKEPAARALVLDLMARLNCKVPSRSSPPLPATRWCSSFSIASSTSTPRCLAT